MISAWQRYAFYLAVSFMILGAMEYARAGGDLGTLHANAPGQDTRS